MSKKRIHPLDFRQLSPHLQYIWKFPLCWGSIVNNFLLNTCPGFPRYFACPKLPSVQKIPSCVGLAHPCPVGWADPRPWVVPPPCPRVVALEYGSRDLEQGGVGAGTHLSWTLRHQFESCWQSTHPGVCYCGGFLLIPPFAQIDHGRQQFDVNLLVFICLSNEAFVLCLYI